MLTAGVNFFFEATAHHLYRAVNWIRRTQRNIEVSRCTRGVTVPEASSVHSSAELASVV